jgi:hypothetical protein
MGVRVRFLEKEGGKDNKRQIENMEEARNGREGKRLAIVVRASRRVDEGLAEESSSGNIHGD